MRNPERVSLRPLLGGLILLLALTVIGATRFNSAEQREILDRTGSQLSAYTSTAAAMVTVWTGVQRDAVAEMARYDMLRLLAAEIAETDLPVALLRELGETPWTEQEHGRHSGLDARDRQALRDISPHATLIYRKFVEFISRHDFAGAALLDRTLEPVMLVGQGWQADTRTLLKQRRSKGALSGAGMLPVRLQGERLLVDFYCPVTAPGYVSADDSPQGILLVTCDIGKLLGGVGQSSELGYMSLLLETGGDLVQAIGMGERPSLNLVTLPAGFGQDMTPRDMVLPAISGTMDCLVVGQPVPGTSWYAAVACRADSVRQEQDDMAWRVWTMAGLLFLCLAGILVWFYWWLGIRRERGEVRELKDLYATMSRQRCLLDTVLRAMHSALAWWMVKAASSMPIRNSPVWPVVRERCSTLCRYGIFRIIWPGAWNAMWNSSGGQGRNFPIRKTCWSRASWCTSMCSACPLPRKTAHQGPSWWSIGTSRPTWRRNSALPPCCARPWRPLPTRWKRWTPI